MAQTYEQITKVGSAEFIRRKNAVPGTDAEQTIFTTKIPGLPEQNREYGETYTTIPRGWAGVLRIPLTGVTGFFYEDYKKIADVFHGYGIKLQTSKDSFARLRNGLYIPDQANSTTTALTHHFKSGDLELKANGKPYGNYEGQPDDTAFVAKLKSEKLWEKYHNGWSPFQQGIMCTSGIAGMVAGALVPVLNNWQIGPAPMGGIIVGVPAILGAGAGLGAGTFISKAYQAFAEPWFYDKIATSEEAREKYLAKLDKRIQKLDLRFLQVTSRARDLERSYPENMWDQIVALSDEARGIDKVINTLYEAAGLIFEDNSYKPGLVIRFTGKEKKDVMEFFEPFVKEKSIVSKEARVINPCAVELGDWDTLPMCESDLEKETAEHAKGPAGKEFLDIDWDLVGKPILDPDAIPVNNVEPKTEKKTVAVAYQPRKFEEYILLEELGSGGIGKVHKAEDPDGNIVTIKVPLTFDAEKHFRKPQKTIETITELEHPNLIKTYHVNIGEKPYEIREYVEGEDLEAKLSRGKLPTEEAFKILREIASGLAYAHQKDLVHGDVKPKNVLITKDGTPKVADFDSAKIIDPEEIKRSMSMTKDLKSVLFTVDYTAPEVLREHKQPTKASDVYSFGALAFRVLAGMPKNDANEPLEVYCPEVGFGSFKQIFKKCLEPKSQDRYQSMEEVAKELGAEISRPEAVREVLKKIRIKGETEVEIVPVVSAGEIKESVESQIVNGTVVNRGKVSEKFKTDGLGTIPDTERRELQLEE